MKNPTSFLFFPAGGLRLARIDPSRQVSMDERREQKRCIKGGKTKISKHLRKPRKISKPTGSLLVLSAPPLSFPTLSANACQILSRRTRASRTRFLRLRRARARARARAANTVSASPVQGPGPDPGANGPCGLSDVGIDTPAITLV